MNHIIRKIIPVPIINYVKGVRAYYDLTSTKKARQSIGKVNAKWRNRINLVISSPDNQYIPRVDSAGKIEKYYITMHNGVKVCAYGYYGSGNLNMLIENKGVHEPQEEKAFEEIIQLLPEKCTMLELGAYWGFYSLSLLNRKPMATCYLVEPNIRNLISGKINFKLNNREGVFFQAKVGATPQKQPKTIAVDEFCKKHKINHLDILHADIQRFELKMLKGAKRMLSERRVDYIFISTHTNQLHQDCIKELKAYGYLILASADLDETYSVDGLIVAKKQGIEEPSSISISKRKIT